MKPRIYTILHEETPASLIPNIAKRRVGVSLNKKVSLGLWSDLEGSMEQDTTEGLIFFILAQDLPKMEKILQGAGFQKKDSLPTENSCKKCGR